MPRNIGRAAGVFFILLFFVFSLTAGTFGWQSLDQQARNDTQSEAVRLAELLKLEKQPDGTQTEIPIPGAAFYLFTADGRQIGGLYYTDEAGKISVWLPPGEYYFEEVYPGPSHTFDTDEDGSRIMRYPFTVTGTETEPVLVAAYNVRQQGELTIEKTVKNKDGSELTEEQRQQEFRFTVTFSDGGTYVCRIDGGEPQEVESGGTILLKHGQKAVFEGLPVGVTYTVTETPVPGYTVTSSGHRGNITVEGNTASFVNCYAFTPPAEPGQLEILKEVVNADGSELTEEQRQQEFAFTVTFSDGGTYVCRIDGGEPQEVESGGTILLKHGQKAVFEGLPDGVTYTVRESDTAGYFPSMEETSGVIAEGNTAQALFYNYLPEKTAKIIVTKKLAGEYPQEDADREFHFTIIINGEETEFTLKPGESIEFEVPPGTEYEIIEDDYSEDGYYQSIENGTGIIFAGTAEAVVTNTYVNPQQIRIEGEKTWELGGFDVPLPESILVQLKQGDRVVEEAIVTPDENGEWHYAFTAPKYDADGNEIQYTITEVPVEGFLPSYDGFDILNTYLPPVLLDLPLVRKAVEGEDVPETEFYFLLRGENGAPMPEGSQGDSKVISITGSGEGVLGEITFREPGTYTYTISEINEGAPGWSYDTAVYVLTAAVTQEDGELQVSYALTKDGESVEDLCFTNRYTSESAEEIGIDGTKIWEHGDNPKENWPDSIFVYVYADGELAAQQLVTAADNWQYHFDLPRYSRDGHEIVYTIEEEPVLGYASEVHGYDIVNSYTGIQTELTPQAQEPSGASPAAPQANHTTPQQQKKPAKTEDSSNPVLWIFLTAVSFAGVSISFIIGHRRRKKSQDE